MYYYNSMNIVNNTITNRELETLKLISKGLDNQEIARRLCISIHTVKAHIEKLYRKFGTHSKVSAVIFAMKAGLINLDEI